MTSGEIVPILNCDGLCEPNPNGVACWGWIALDSDGVILGQACGHAGTGEGMTNNLAEYEAALAALRWAWQAGYRQVVLRSDSQLLIKQALGEWGCQAPTLQPRLARLRKAAALLAITFEWIPRTQNARADELSREAYRQVVGREPPERHGKPAPASVAADPEWDALARDPAPTVYACRPRSTQATCRSCGAAILWRINDATGRRAQLDATPNPNGNCRLLDGDRYEVLPLPSMATLSDVLFTNHFQTCPQASQWGHRATQPKEMHA